MSMSQTIPTYRQLDPKGFFCAMDYLIEEGEAFEYEGEPNAQMEALNEPALVKLKEFYDRLDAGARSVAEKNGRHYAGIPRSLDQYVAEATTDARRVQLRAGDGGVPLMGAKKEGIHVKRVSLEPAAPIIRKKSITK